MDKKIFIKHHLGLGDCIVHNGMIRKISEDNPNYEVWISCKSQNIENVRFMFRDNPNIKIVEVSDDYETDLHLRNTKYEKIISTFTNGSQYCYSDYFDDSFYLLSGIDPEIKREYFHIERDLDRELEVYNELVSNKNTNEYIFLHEKQEELILIDRKKINNNLPIIYADKKYKTFELLTVIERAKECHIISSSFLSLFMCKKFNKNIYAHMYSDRLELAQYIEKNNINVIL